jgi:hypothetical protein
MREMKILSQRCQRLMKEGSCKAKDAKINSEDLRLLRQGRLERENRATKEHLYSNSIILTF